VAEGGYGRALVAAASVAGGVSLAWLAVTLLPRPPEQPYPEPGDWAACTAAVGAFAFALAGLALVLRGARVGPPVASFATTLLGLAWLTWPVWLSPWLAGRAGLVGWLVPAHPLLAVNSVVRHLGIWDEQPLAYNLTTLNRDVPYPLPGGILRTVLVHGAIGVVLLSAAILPGRVRRGGVSGHG
jgi:hypothetical protein